VIYLANFEYYKIFVAVVEEKSMTRAAETLCVSQPAVTQTIKNLERDLGGRVFIRSNKGLELTAEGRMLYEKLKPAISIIDNAETEFGQYNELQKGEVRIGVSTILTKILLMDTIKQFKQAYPGIKIIIENGLTSNSMSLLQKGLLDIVVFNKEAGDETYFANLNIKPLTELEYSFIYNPEYFECRNMKECMDYPFIIQREKSNTRETINNFFKIRNTKPNIAVEVVSNELVIEMVADGIGIGCVYKKLASKNNKVREIPCDTKPINTGIYIATHETNMLTAAAKAFMEIAKE